MSSFDTSTRTLTFSSGGSDNVDFTSNTLFGAGLTIVSKGIDIF